MSKVRGGQAAKLCVYGVGLRKPDAILYNKKQLQLQQIKEEAYQQEKRRRREQCLSYVAYIPPKDKELYTLDNLLNGLNDALTDNE